MKPLLAAVCALALCGCGEGVAPVLESPGTIKLLPGTTRGKFLAESKAFRPLSKPVAGAMVAHLGLDNVTASIPLGVAGGRFEVQARTDETWWWLDVSSFEVSIPDVVFTEEQVPPRGLILTRVKLVLEQPTALTLDWYGDGMFGWANGELPLKLQSWVRLQDGTVSPLEFVAFPAAVDLAFGPDQTGALRASLSISREGPFWDWDGLMVLQDLEVSVEAVEADQPDVQPAG